MDTHQALFSRGSDKPAGSDETPNQIDVLFQSLSGRPSAGAASEQNRYQIQSELGMASDTSNTSTKDSRQSALLSLLGPGPSNTSNSSIATSAQQPTTTTTSQPIPQQVPTPPGTGHTPDSDPAKGKLLLEQLIGGQRSTFQESKSSAAIVTSPKYEAPPLIPHQSQNSSPQAPGSYPADEPSSEESSNRNPYAEPPVSEPRTQSMFNFVSGFDVLAGSGSGSGKKKNVVDSSSAQPTSARASGSTDASWATPAGSMIGSNASAAKSIENLMDSIIHRTPPAPHPMALPISPPNEPAPPEQLYNDSDFTSPRPAPVAPEPSSARQAPVLTSVPVGANQGTPQKTKKPKKRQQSPGFHPPTIVFDVSQPLDDIQAPREFVKSTAIALVKQDAVFLPGTTIGATHWVAYAMTKGRMRVISRSSGDRTLLQLPSNTFSSTAAVTDMAVYGNRLAGVTSDGGFVVWELPQTITDDAPGQLLLCVAPPAISVEGLRFVKWHPKNPDTLAVASDSTLYLLDLLDVAANFRSQAYNQFELKRIATVIDLPTDIVAFDFDHANNAIATVSVDSVLALYPLDGKQPASTHKIRGDDRPSSITPVEDGLVIGRKNGTIFQLFNHLTKSVHATIKFINSNRPEDPEMFGHANYDARIGALWIANSRRDSLIAFKLAFDDGDGEGKGIYFEQACEFCGPKPTINFVLLSADQDPTGEEAEAACVAAKVPAGELALVAFSVHASGVDQVLIRKEWFDEALMRTPAKFPPALHQGQRAAAPPLDKPAATAISSNVPVAAPAPILPPTRIRTPPSDEFESQEPPKEPKSSKKSSTVKANKNVAFRDGVEEKGKDKATEPVVSEAVLAQLVAREMKKTEDNLHTRFGRLLGKEMEKQHNRLDDARANDQHQEFQRQEKILQLISTELTKNTTRVVEMAVKAEVHNSVLPKLESITRSEVSASLRELANGTAIARSVSNTVSADVEQILTRPDVVNHIANSISKSVTPVIDRTVKDIVAKTLNNDFAQYQATIHQEWVRELRNELTKFKNESVTYQNETARAQEATIRDLEHSVRLLSDKLKFVPGASQGVAPPSTGGHRQYRSNDSPTSRDLVNLSQAHLQQQQQQHPPPPGPPPQHTNAYQPPNQNFQSPQQVQPPPPQGNHNWFAQGIAAPQASHPINISSNAQAALSHTPPAHGATEEWDETYLAVLTSQHSGELQALLARSNPDVVMPLNSRPPLSQAVILTLLHKLTAVVAETPPTDEVFKASLWWLHRTATIINTSDPQISPYIARVVPNVQTLLTTTKQRMALLPGGPQLLESARSITDVQDIIRSKPL